MTNNSNDEADHPNSLNTSSMYTNTLEPRPRCSLQSIFQFSAVQRFPLGQKVKALGYEWIYAAKIQHIAAYWQPSSENVFLQTNYLQALEESQTPNLDFRYLLAFKSGKPIAGLTLQLLNVEATQSIRTLRMSELRGLADRLRLWLANWSGTYRFMIWGNMFLTGQYNQWWDVAEEELPLLQEASLQVLDTLGQQEKVQVLMARDWLQHDPTLDRAGYHAIDFQPSMILKLPKAWKNFDDYLEAMSSKYRVRARRASKKSDGILFRELDLRQIELFADDLHHLHRSVVEQADFNMLWAGKDYFVQLKEKLGADFRLVACFEKESLVGFFTTIRNGKTLEANFLGFTTQANHEHQLYLSMLYKMVEQGFESCCERIEFARTALEIKSSVGALAHQTYVYLKHSTPLLNWLLPWIVRFGEPKESWTPRHPFRAEKFNSPTE